MIHYHDRFSRDRYLNNDIALVKIKPKSDGRGIRFGDRVVPVCLPSTNDIYDPALNCTVSGWGTLGPTKSGYSRYLQVRMYMQVDSENINKMSSVLL